MISNFFYVYVLLSSIDKKFYVGYTSNLESRIQQHNDGLNTSTKHRRPLHLIYYEAHLSKKDALRRESYFKTTSGKRTLRLMLKEYLTSNKG